MTKTFKTVLMLMLFVSSAAMGFAHGAEGTKQDESIMILQKKAGHPCTNKGESIRQLTESETEDVEDIAINGTGLPQYMAQSLLEATTERYHFAECPLIDEPSGMGRGIPQGYTQEDLSKAMGLSVSAKPNPATTWVAIDFTLPGDAKTAAVEIVNSLGEKVMYGQLNGNVGQKVLDLRELSNGVYTITILCGEYYQTEKLVITK